MPAFGEGFINVATEGGFEASMGLDFTARLRRMVNDINAVAPLPERTLWLPPGEYRVSAPFTFPPTVTLSFAPGAILVPIRGVSPAGDTVEIAGVVDAPLVEIFAANASGRIVFVGVGTPRVYPEWWGAAKNPRTPDARADTVALQAAFRAAVIDREASSTASRAPITVCLFNDYQVDEPVVVNPTGARPLRAVSILGALGRRLSGPPPSRRRPAALLEIHRVLQVSIRDLSLAANGFSQTCLSVSCDVARDGLPHQITLVDCSFEGARFAQVLLADLAATLPQDGELKAFVRGCRFAVEDSRHTDPEQPPLDLDARAEGADPIIGQMFSRAAGLAVQASFGAELAVEGGEFRGFLRRGIHVTGGVRSEVLACSFRFREWPGNLFPNGTAIALDRAGVRGAFLPSLQATSCVATTPSFLWVDAPSAGDWEKSPETVKRGITVVLTAVSHRVDPDVSAVLGLYWPPSVVWRGERPMSLANVPGNSTLTLVGCEFEVPRASLPPTPERLRQKAQGSDDRWLARFNVLPRIPRVFVNSDLRWVYNLGTFSNYGPMPEIGAFDEGIRTTTRSLGVGPPQVGATPGPTIFLLLGWVRRSYWMRLLFAWADWSGAPALTTPGDPL